MHTLDLLSFGSRIRKRREELLISKKELAEKLGITSKFMDDIESGARGVSLKNLVLLSQILEISTDYLLFGNGSKASKQVFNNILESCPQAKLEVLAEIIGKIIESYDESGPPVQRVVCSRAISPCY